jgi:hypothetical protein
MAQNEFGAKIKRIRSDNDTEFKNTQVEDYLDEEGIKHEFLPPTLLNKMRWSKGRIEVSQIWQKPCLMSTRLPTGFRPKRSTRHVIPQIVSIITSFSRRHHMSYSPVTSQISLILESLKVSAMFFKRDLNLQNLLLKYMNIFCLAMT